LASSALFLGAALVARPSWLAGVTVSTTSVAVVYAVMLELGFNRTTYGKAILAACLISDLGTVPALGLIFSPFTKKTLLLRAISLVSLLILLS
jgi:Kef-type K+ transport system membrane component KefB